MKVMELEESAVEKKKHAKWFWNVFLICACVFIICSAVVVVIDPFFHYHAPLECLEYPLIRDNERYQNDGILRHFSYDTIITGTSMTENFKTSDVDYLLNANSVKIPFAGGLYKEINDNLVRAFEYGNEIKKVIRCLDYECLVEDKDATKSIYDYAEYLTNDNYFDDVNYLLNKEVFGRAIEVIAYTLSGQETTTFDKYANWMSDNYFGTPYVYMSYEHGENTLEKRRLTEEERIMIQENIAQNVVALAKDHPETTFYLYFPPYSIGYWDELRINGEIDWRLEAEQVAIEAMIDCSNIKLYAFSDAYDRVCDLNNYADKVHYAEWVNYYIITCMTTDEHLLTTENYLDYLSEIREFYMNYDYSSIYLEE